MGKLQFSIKKIFNFFAVIIFLQFSGLDKDQINTDPKHWYQIFLFFFLDGHTQDIKASGDAASYQNIKNFVIFSFFGVKNRVFL